DLQEAAGGGGGPLLELPAEALQGMTGDEESERLLLEGQPLALAPLGDVTDALRGRRVRAVVQATEKTGLPLLAVALVLLSGLHGPVERGVEGRAPRVEGVEGSALDEALHHAAVHGPHVHALA